MRTLAQIGRPAVPDLVAELGIARSDDNTLSRGSSDSRCEPSAIRGLARPLDPRDCIAPASAQQSIMALQVSMIRRSCSQFMRRSMKLDHDPRDYINYVTYGRAIEEILCCRIEQR